MALMIAIATARDGCGRGDDDFLMMPEGARRRRHNDDAAHHHIIFFREQVRERNVLIAQSSPVKKRGRETIQGWFRNQSQPSRPILLATDFYDGSNANERTPARRERRRRRKAGLIRLTIKPGKKRRVRGEDLGRRGGSRGDTKKEEEEEEKKEKGSGRKKLLLLLPPSHEPQTRKAKKSSSPPFSLATIESD